MFKELTSPTSEKSNVNAASPKPKAGETGKMATATISKGSTKTDIRKLYKKKREQQEKALAAASEKKEQPPALDSSKPAVDARKPIVDVKKSGTDARKPVPGTRKSGLDDPTLTEDVLRDGLRVLARFEGRALSS